MTRKATEECVSFFLIHFVSLGDAFMWGIDGFLATTNMDALLAVVRLRPCDLLRLLNQT
jgi:hypothetical protein